jgi:DNA-binding transcriptional LysR family regulator
MSVGDLQRLRAFALVLDLGSISAAASVLGYTQSAVSQQLAALEREVGTALVDRAQRPLRATRAGASLRPHVERVLATLGGAEAAVEDLRGGTPRLRLAAFPSGLSSFVSAAVRDLPHSRGSSSRSCSSRRRRRSSASAAATPTSPSSITCPGSRCQRPRACNGAAC